ncbi:hypothetical protein CP985_14390 [Malaciobacter mytili LMG 24559]|uniref:Uncharacterized protein n=1 Tax=Malaciobacter mytili LMG 24559 TaxID=1032238 RepID=A0AAX2AEJ3_9BACT|nr:hypothetical protein [Malaciobacter mytili]AXH16321.1 hypothetical protein AMYT_a0021 [Malaciobacter mytili LMG 24559]RXK12393.1 hypothetical protein CP985_14390 [Malaciobacter mytili LMG 24559]
MKKIKKIIKKLLRYTKDKNIEELIGYSKKYNAIITIACKDYPFNFEIQDMLNNLDKIQWDKLLKYFENGLSYLKELEIFEEKIILQNIERANEDNSLVVELKYKGMSIHNPYYDESGIESVEPFKYYKKYYVYWLKRIEVLYLESI